MGRKRRYRRSRSRRSYSRTVKFKVGQIVMGTAIVTVAEPMLDGVLDKVVPLQVGGVDLKDAAKVALGMYLTKKGGKAMKAAGYAMAIIGTRNIVRGFVGTRLQLPSGDGW
jgi:hypothetical protein